MKQVEIKCPFKKSCNNETHFPYRTCDVCSNCLSDKDIPPSSRSHTVFHSHYSSWQCLWLQSPKFGEKL